MIDVFLHESQIVTVRPSGRIGMGAALSRFRQVLEQLEIEGWRSIVLDLSESTFIDSAGLGEIMAARRRTLRFGGRLVIAGPCGKVRDLIALTRLGELIEIYEKLDEAVASYELEAAPV